MARICRAEYRGPNGRVVAVCTRSPNHQGAHHAFDATTDIKWNGVWKLAEVHTDHCPGKCYIFDNGASIGPHRYHIPAHNFWGPR